MLLADLPEDPATAGAHEREVHPHAMFPALRARIVAVRGSTVRTGSLPPSDDAVAVDDSGDVAPGVALLPRADPGSVPGAG